MKTKMAELFSFRILIRRNLDFASRILDIAEPMLVLILKSRNRMCYLLTSSTGRDIGAYIVEYHSDRFVVVAFGCEREYWDEFMTYMVIDAKGKLFQPAHKRTALEFNVNEYDVDSQTFLHNCGFIGRQENDVVVMTFDK